MNKKHILVLMSTYNGEKYLEEQLDSIRHQCEVEVSLLVCDDKSKDKTKELLVTYKENHPEFDIRLIPSSENLGFARSFSALVHTASLEKTNYDFYAFADQDDVWLADKLFVAASRLSERESQGIPISYSSNVTVVRSDLSVVKDKWKPEDIHISRDTAIVQSFAFGCTQVFNKAAMDLYVKHAERTIMRHDFLIYQLCVFFGEVIYNPHSYIYYRQHSNNQIGSTNLMKRWKKRFRNFGHLNDHILEKQSLNFLIAYKDLLTIDDLQRFVKLAYYKSNIFTKLSLLFDRKIKFNQFERNFFYKLKILLGGV